MFVTAFQFMNAFLSDIVIIHDDEFTALRLELCMSEFRNSDMHNCSDDRGAEILEATSHFKNVISSSIGNCISGWSRVN